MGVYVIFASYTTMLTALSLKRLRRYLNYAFEDSNVHMAHFQL